MDANLLFQNMGEISAYTWQRITSWIFLVAIIGHVVKFRFIEYPDSFNQGQDTYFYVKLDLDQGLYTVAAQSRGNAL